MTTYLNGRRSVNAIEGQLFREGFGSGRKGRGQVFDLGSLFTIDEHALFYMLRADRNYVQD